MSPQSALFAVLILLLIAANAQAAGKKRSRSQSTPPSQITTPVRQIVVEAVAGKAFPIPSGSIIDLNSDIRSMIITSLTQTQNLAPADPQGEEDAENPCSTHIELRASVGTLEMNLQEYGLTIGYSPVGAHSGITSAQGETRVKVGSIAMDFSLWRCSNGRCTAVAASTANQSAVDTSQTFTINFGLITTGASLASHPSFNKILRKIVQAGIEKLAASPRISDLPWSATIREANPGQGTVLIDAGSQDRLSAQQKLVVYSAIPAIGLCNVFKAIAYGHVERVDPVSSIVTIDQTLDASDAKEGDLVMLK